MLMPAVTALQVCPMRFVLVFISAAVAAVLAYTSFRDASKHVLEEQVRWGTQWVEVLLLAVDG